MRKIELVSCPRCKQCGCALGADEFLCDACYAKEEAAFELYMERQLAEQNAEYRSKQVDTYEDMPF